MEVSMVNARQLRAINYQASCRCLSSRFSALSVSDGPNSPVMSFRRRPTKGFNPAASIMKSLTSRLFSTSSSRSNWLQPRKMEKGRSRVGRPRMQTGGSIRGTTIVWGDYGLRMVDHDRRISAKQLKVASETIFRRLKGLDYKLYKRVNASVGVYTKGNESRMGKGKGKFDYWAARVPVNRVIFELSGQVHEKVVRDAFRLAGHKLPGLYEFIKKGAAPVVGITKLEDGVTLESLKQARREPRTTDDEDAPVIPPVHTMEAPKTTSPPPP